ncbi:MAG TPA: AMP-binding protein [Dissulfurispiraceae bacterium]|nr:AMP-binding protein [Dissulfurispiraceae bacterium]
MKTFEPVDMLPAEKIAEIQGRLLNETVRRAYINSQFYRNRFSNLGIAIDGISSLSHLKLLPLTDRKDFQENNWDFLAVNKRDIAEVVSTTGTSGEPAFVAMTANDLIRLAVNEERSFGSAGAAKGDLFHLAVTCDNLFIAGIAYYGGLSRLGAAVARIGPQNLLRHLDLALSLKPAGMVAVPSFIVHMSRRMKEIGITAEEIGLKKIVLIGDSIRDADFKLNALGILIEEAFGKIFYSTYGITEAQLSFFECDVHQGLHSHPDFIIAEIVDDEGNLLRDGEVGELVLTTLQIEGMPMIRYRTGDITFRLTGQCLCGRNSPRIGPILGRKCQRLKYKGVTIYPKTIENALLGISDVINYQIEACTGDDQTDMIILRVGAHCNGNGLKAILRDVLLAKARVTPRIEIERPEEVEKKLFEGGSRKAVTFKDRRACKYG